jgi:hypothetical protein
MVNSSAQLVLHLANFFDLELLRSGDMERLMAFRFSRLLNRLTRIQSLSIKPSHFPSSVGSMEYVCLCFDGCGQTFLAVVCLGQKPGIKTTSPIFLRPFSQHWES